MIYFGGRYTCTIPGSVWKEIRCEGCQREFVYLLSRTGSGAGRSPYYIDNDGAQRRAQQAAVKNLQRQLERDCDPVACPDCGLFQPNMVRLLRRRRWGWLHVVGLIGVAAAFVVAWMCGVADPGPRRKPFFEELTSMPSVAVLGIGIALIGLSWGGRLFHDPNADSVERANLQEHGSAGPYRRAEFDALIREATAREEAAQRAAANPILLPASDRQVWCPSCEQTFATSSHDRCPLCHADWTQTPPQEVT